MRFPSKLAVLAVAVLILTITAVGQSTTSLPGASPTPKAGYLNANNPQQRDTDSAARQKPTAWGVSVPSGPTGDLQVLVRQRGASPNRTTWSWK
jgi:hypothetical protein